MAGRAPAALAAGWLLACSTPISTDCIRVLPAALELQLAERSAIEAALERVERSNPRRRRILAELFRDAGCADGELVDKPSGRQLPNLSCTLPGASATRIVVGAHFDKVEPGDGAADNWSGAVLLPSLFASLARRERRYTFEFVGFAAEERGLVGSSRYVLDLDEAERRAIRAMVNIDTLGLGPVQIDVPSSHPELACHFAAAASLLAMPLERGGVPPGSSSDFAPFKHAGIPVVDLTAVTLVTFDVLHSPRDTLGAIDREDYYAAYRLIATYLALLDAALPEARAE